MSVSALAQAVARETAARRPRVGVVCDFREERWISMDLVADMILSELQGPYASQVDAMRIQPSMVSHMPGGRARNVDRLLNRFWDYPAYLRGIREKFDVFHLVDHSYAQLVHELPLGRTIVTCHDLDTFRSVLEQGKERRSIPFRMMASRILNGLRKAARIVCVSAATRDELLSHKLVDPAKVLLIPNGIGAVYKTAADPAADCEAARLLGDVPGIELVNVGSTIPRKRMDILLKTFAHVRKTYPTARLIRIGGPFTLSQDALASELGLTNHIRVLPFISDSVLAAIYRRSTLVAQPAEAEGFGLPLAEALACGAAVVASDLPVTREVGGTAATYCVAGNVESWGATVAGLLHQYFENPDDWQLRRLSVAALAPKFSWRAHAGQLASVYRDVLK